MNSHAEALLETQREKLLGRETCALFPINRGNGNLEKYRKVVLSGESLSEDYSTRLGDGNELWLRQRVNKLGDGVAIRTSDATELKASEERYRSLSSFSNSVFESAPYSILGVDRNGVIQAMNASAERLTGYTREDIAGKLPLIELHEPNEPTRRSKRPRRALEKPLEGFDLLTAPRGGGPCG